MQHIISVLTFLLSVILWILSESVCATDDCGLILAPINFHSVYLFCVVDCFFSKINVRKKIEQTAVWFKNRLKERLICEANVFKHNVIYHVVTAKAMLFNLDYSNDKSWSFTLY